MTLNRALLTRPGHGPAAQGAEILENVDYRGSSKDRVLPVDSSHPAGPALVAAAADADPVTLLVLGWLAAIRSENTRTAYARTSASPRRGGPAARRPGSPGARNKECTR